MTSSLRSGNLSSLKKRWEQPKNLEDSKGSAVPPASQSRVRSRPPSLSKSPSISENPPPLKSPALLTAQAGPPATSVQQPSAAPETSPVEEQRGMDKDDKGRPKKVEDQVPTSPCASYEKPSVPLNNLKMKFERGEGISGKVNHLQYYDLCSSEVNNDKRQIWFSLIEYVISEALCLLFLNCFGSCACIGCVSQTSATSKVLMVRFLVLLVPQSCKTWLYFLNAT